MSNQLFRENLILKIKGAVEEAKNAALIDHQYLAGRIREIALSKLFFPMLGDKFSIGTGKIADYEGGSSKETDIVIYSKQNIPALLFSSEFGYFPKEGVLASIEVKSTLAAKELDDAKAKFDALDALKITFGKYDSEGKSVGHIVRNVVKSIFAFSSDLVEKNELERLLERFPDCKTDPFLNSICVVGKGYWTFDFAHKKWLHAPATDEHEEVVRFLSSLVNSLNDTLESRKNPRIGLYFTDKNPEEVP